MMAVTRQSTKAILMILVRIRMRMAAKRIQTPRRIRMRARPIPAKAEAILTKAAAILVMVPIRGTAKPTLSIRQSPPSLKSLCFPQKRSRHRL